MNQSWNKAGGYKDTKSGDDRIVEIAPNLLTVLKELKLKTGSMSFVLPPIRFHDLRATWATIMLSNGIPPLKVMIMGGWCDLKTMQFYVRRSGVDITSITDGLNLHDPTFSGCKVLDFGDRG